jgi:hypothetical protein
MDALLSGVFASLAFPQLSSDCEHMVLCMDVLLTLAPLGGATYADAAAILGEIFEPLAVKLTSPWTCNNK